MSKFIKLTRHEVSNQIAKDVYLRVDTIHKWYSHAMGNQTYTIVVPAFNYQDETDYEYVIETPEQIMEMINE